MFVIIAYSLLNDFSACWYVMWLSCNHMWMSFGFIGKCAMAHVLSLDNNITVLLPFMEPKGISPLYICSHLLSLSLSLSLFILSSGHKEHDSKLSKSSISSRYAAVLILQVLQSKLVVWLSCDSHLTYTGSCNLSHDFLTTHSRRLLAMSEFFKGE